MEVKFFLKEGVSSVWSILAYCRSGGIQSEAVCGYKCVCLCNRYYIYGWEWLIRLYKDD
jgi:ferredoxin